MIISQLSGGLGNQMFQFAAAYALARRNGVPCAVDRSAFLDDLRSYELGCLTGAPAAAPAWRLPLAFAPGSRRLPGSIRRRLSKRRTLGGRSIVCFREESPFVLDERLFHLGGSAYLMGYFQSQKYFLDVAPDIRAAFAFAEEPGEENARLMEAMGACESVAVHVRRGDYVSNPHTADYHGLCGLDYYGRAFDALASRVVAPAFWVFSDDPEWAEKNIVPPGPVRFVRHNRGSRSAQDLRLMAACRHQIIANSSFSWWGAWLNPLPQKVVIAPRRWLAGAGLEVKDLIPETWIQL